MRGMIPVIFMAGDPPVLEFAMRISPPIRQTGCSASPEDEFVPVPACPELNVLSIHTRRFHVHLA
jgi:hypothetical protein